VFDNSFDPYDALQILNANVKNLDQNLATLIAAHNSLARRIEEQGETIDILTKGLNTANQANQILMSDMLTSMTEKIKDMK
jgi:chorismate-pyruvate lyase